MPRVGISKRGPSDLKPPGKEARAAGAGGIGSLSHGKREGKSACLTFGARRSFYHGRNCVNDTRCQSADELENQRSVLGELAEANAVGLWDSFLLRCK
jgi:hypothetical protein